MKKKMVGIGLVVLLLAVAAGTAFAESGRKFELQGEGWQPKVSINDGAGSGLIRILEVTETRSGLQVKYQFIKGVTYGVNFGVTVKYRDGTSETSTNKEFAKLNWNGTFTFTLSYKYPSSIDTVSIQIREFTGMWG